MNERNFKDIKGFENDLIEILSSLIKDKLNEVIQISLETHNMERIKELIRLLSILIETQDIPRVNQLTPIKRKQSF